jgi:DtxR family manganese transport transcriptional regulator
VNRFQRTRDDHSSELAEDYVELIQTLQEELGRARPGQLAARLGVSQASVTKTVKRLEREGYVVAPPYQGVALTEAGLRLAASVRARHRLVKEFLEAIGVSPQQAESDSEGIEHHVSEETLAAMRRFLGDSRS